MKLTLYAKVTAEELHGVGGTLPLGPLVAAARCQLRCQSQPPASRARILETT